MIMRKVRQGRVGVNSSTVPGLVLLEAQDESSAQARIVMTADEAGELSGKLLRFANKARQGLAGEAKRSPSQVDEEEGLGYPPSLLT